MQWTYTLQYTIGNSSIQDVSVQVFEHSSPFILNEVSDYMANQTVHIPIPINNQSEKMIMKINQINALMYNTLQSLILEKQKTLEYQKISMTNYIKINVITQEFL